MGKHRAIERFAATFLILSVLMAGLMGTIVFRKAAADSKMLASQSMYTKSVSMSRSHVKGTVESVMVSEDRTKAFLLLKMESMNQLSASADDYMVFLTGSNEHQGYTDLKCQPSGGVYVFGTSGYMAVYLVNNEPFENQILNLVVRGIRDYSTELSEDGEVNVAEVPSSGDASFENFDQMQIYFNPGATDVRHAAFLDSEGIDVEAMYKEAVAEPLEEEYRQVLHQDLQEMFEYQYRMTEFERRLTEGVNNITLSEPDVPDSIATDVIRAYTYEGNQELEWSESSNGWVDADGVKYDSDSYYLDLDTDYDFPGGFNFDWQTTTLDDGWLDDLSEGTTIRDYLDDQQTAYQQATEDGELELNLDEVKWYQTDGDEFVVNAKSDQADVKNVSADIQSLTGLWESYFNTKLKYETEDLKNLLYLERDARMISDTYSENIAEGVIVNY